MCGKQGEVSVCVKGEGGVCGKGEGGMCGKRYGKRGEVCVCEEKGR